MLSHRIPQGCHYSPIVCSVPVGGKGLMKPPHACRCISILGQWCPNPEGPQGMPVKREPRQLWQACYIQQRDDQSMALFISPSGGSWSTEALGRAAWSSTLPFLNTWIFILEGDLLKSFFPSLPLRLTLANPQPGRFSHSLIQWIFVESHGCAWHHGSEQDIQEPDEMENFSDLGPGNPNFANYSLSYFGHVVSPPGPQFSHRSNQSLDLEYH